MAKEYTPEQVAKSLGVHKTTVHKWIRQGLIHSRKQGLSRPYHFISAEELERIRKEGGYPPLPTDEEETQPRVITV